MFIEEEIPQEDVKRLLAELLERAVRDLFILDPREYDFVTAYHLVFDDTYRIYYDGPAQEEQEERDSRELSLDEILQLVELDKEYIRWQVKKQLARRRPQIASLLFGLTLTESLQDLPSSS